MSIVLDSKTFHKRAKIFLDAFNKNQEFKDTQSVLFVCGSSDGELSYQKSIALQNWWIGYEFPETITLVTKHKIIFLTSVKKGSILETLRSNSDDAVEFEILTRTKDESLNQATYTKMISLIPEGRVGFIPKESPTGKLVTEWKSAIERSNRTLEYMDVSNAIAMILASKDKDELSATATAAQLTAATMKNYFIDYMTGLIDSGKKIKHEVLAENIERTHTEERRREKLHAPADINWKLVEWCYTPIVQSGGKYDLKASAISNEQNLHAGTILCSFGARYKSYCSNIGRTFLINPEKAKEENYEFLLELQNYLLSIMKAGIPCSEVYSRAIAYISEKKPELKDKFVKNCGFGMGIEFRESFFSLNQKNDQKLLPNMIMNFGIGFQNIENSSTDPRNKVYSLWLADTIQITDTGVVVLTDVEKELSKISYTSADDEEEEEKAVITLPKRGAILESQLRNNEDRADNTNKRKMHQKALIEKRMAEGLAKYSESGDGKAEKELAVFKKFESYRKDAYLPKTIGDLKIIVDRRSESVILPVYGQAVPFHVSTLKNVSKSDEGDFALLRFNFITPGQATGKKDNHAFEDMNATFIRSLSYRSNEVGRLTEISKDINEMKKDIQKREAERIEKAGLVVQGDLVEVKGRRPTRLPDVHVRPVLEGKRAAGDLEIHVNGLRFQSSIKNDQRVDILFSNIKRIKDQY
ncbi:FACT complex subunit spt16 [Globomyces sp. JEL0801]|nr:FACT complex subunit spt16 [Globomyces sp. JEL0801]